MISALSLWFVDTEGGTCWQMFECRLKCTYFGSCSHVASVHCQILARVFHWVSPFLSDSWAARFCTFFTSTWWRATISGCSVKGSTFTRWSWWPCSLRSSTCGGIISWAGVCISSSSVLSHLHLYLCIYNLPLVLVSENNQTQVLARVQSLREHHWSPLTSSYSLW